MPRHAAKEPLIDVGRLLEAEAAWAGGQVKGGVADPNKEERDGLAAQLGWTCDATVHWIGVVGACGGGKIPAALRLQIGEADHLCNIVRVFRRGEADGKVLGFADFGRRSLLVGRRDLECPFGVRITLAGEAI